ncbi:hypothetical protein, partial [Burkholderia multivorans]|uniref:hypothetical protein n=1 Tax=Burkholderia multivorans TaxID=87883 RepID=UPI001C6119AE
SGVNSISFNNTYGCKPNNSPGEAEGFVGERACGANHGYRYGLFALQLGSRVVILPDRKFLSII